MAVSKSFFLRRKGVVGSLQMARMNGQQITKDKASTYHDAQTRAQLVQRMCMATATAFYKEGKDVLSWSVEGARNTNEAMHFLYNKNVAILKELAQQEKGYFKYADKNYLVEKTGFCSNLFLSYGSLPSIKYNAGALNLCQNKKWQLKKGESMVICGYQSQAKENEKRPFIWAIITFFENPAADFFEGLNMRNVYERLQQFSNIKFSDNNTITESNFVQSVLSSGTVRLRITNISSRYGCFRVVTENGKNKYSTSNIATPLTLSGNFSKALATYGVPRDKILNGE